MENKLKFIKSVTALKHFSTATFSKLVSIMETGAVTAGETIFSEGDESKHLYFMVNGEAQIFKRLSSDVEKVLSTIGEKTIFGEMSLFSDQPRTATVRAKTDVTYYRIHCSSFRKAISPDKTGGQKMLETLLFSALERLESTSRELATIYEISRTIVKNLTLEDFCSEVVRHLKYSVPGVDAAAVYLWNEFTEEYEQKAGAGENIKKTHLAGNEQLVSLLSDKKEAVTITEQAILDTALGNILKAKSVLVGPLIKNKLTGFLILANTREPYVYPNSIKDLLNSVCMQLMPAIENIRTMQEKLAKERFDRGRTGSINW
ncbi:MAG: cyclic nucleotide-binding domain-containing protein [Elusimicrobiota bacterium]